MTMQDKIMADPHAKHGALAMVVQHDVQHFPHGRLPAPLQSHRSVFQRRHPAADTLEERLAVVTRRSKARRLAAHRHMLHHLDHVERALDLRLPSDEPDWR